MDNVTHTLIGVTLARVVSTRSDAAFRKAALWASVLASNMPDLDSLYVQWLGGGRLEYLLHHRGYTHTLVWALPQGLLAGAIGILLTGKALARRGRLGALALGIAAALLHIGADYWNDYGVHPFYPFDNRWVRGDFVFIVEPMLWVSMLPLAFASAATRAGKALVAACAAGLLILLAMFMSLLSLPVAILAVQAALILRARWRWGDVRVAVASALLTLLCFRAGSQIARERISAFHSEAAPRERRIDLALAPSPADPFCWRFILASQDPDGAYLAREGWLSLLPGIRSASGCHLRGDGERTAPMRDVSLPARLSAGAGIAWQGEFRGELKELRELAARDCVLGALLRFTQFPFWVTDPREGGRLVTAGDLRYDRERGPGFAELRGGQLDRPCLEPVPPWRTFFSTQP